MGQQALPGTGIWSILATAKNDVVTQRIRMSVHGFRRPGRSLIGVYSYFAEVVSEAGFEKTAQTGIERLAGMAQHLVY